MVSVMFMFSAKLVLLLLALVARVKDLLTHECPQPLPGGFFVVFISTLGFLRQM